MKSHFGTGNFSRGEVVQRDKELYFVSSRLEGGNSQYWATPSHTIFFFIHCRPDNRSVFVTQEKQLEDINQTAAEHVDTLKQMAFAPVCFYLSPQSVFVSFDALSLSHLFLKLLISVSAEL